MEFALNLDFIKSNAFKNKALQNLDYVNDEASAVTNASALASVPSTIEILPAGNEITGRDGRIFSNKKPQNIVKEFLANKARLPIDIEHSTELKAKFGEPAPAIGWIDGIYLNKKGATWANVTWTNAGIDLISNRAYRYISPVFIVDAKNKSIKRLTSAALTNNPNLFLTALNHSIKGKQPESFNMKIICQSLGLDESANEATIVQAINTLKDEKSTALNQAENPTLDKFIPKADHELALNRAEVAEKKLAEITTAGHQAKVDTAINAALESGKIAPATEQYHRNNCKTADGLTSFNSYVNVAPVIADNSSLAGKKPGNEQTALNSDEKYACKQLGITEEEFLKNKEIK